jgi:hypothetical protein
LREAFDVQPHVVDPWGKTMRLHFETSNMRGYATGHRNNNPQNKLVRSAVGEVSQLERVGISPLAFFCWQANHRTPHFNVLTVHALSGFNEKRTFILKGCGPTFPCDFDLEVTELAPCLLDKDHRALERPNGGSVPVQGETVSEHKRASELAGQQLQGVAIVQRVELALQSRSGLLMCRIAWLIHVFLLR